MSIHDLMNSTMYKSRDDISCMRYFLPPKAVHSAARYNFLSNLTKKVGVPNCKSIMRMRRLKTTISTIDVMIPIN